MLEASPKHLLSNDYVLRSSGATLAVLDVSRWRERAEFELDGFTWTLVRERLFGGRFVLQRGADVVARATKPSVFRDRFEVEFGQVAFTLRKPTPFTRRFGVFEGERQVGEIAPASFFSRRVIVDLPSDWPPAVHVYVFWLVLLIWNREKNSDGG